MPTSSLYVLCVDCAVESPCVQTLPICVLKRLNRLIMLPKTYGPIYLSEKKEIEWFSAAVDVSFFQI